MIEPFIDRLEGLFYFSEVPNPACVRIRFSFQINRYSKRVTVQASAFMTFWDVRQAVRGLERKFLEYFHVIYSDGFNQPSLLALQVSCRN